MGSAQCLDGDPLGLVLPSVVDWRRPARINEADRSGGTWACPKSDQTQLPEVSDHASPQRKYREVHNHLQTRVASPPT